MLRLHHALIFLVAALLLAASCDLPWEPTLDDAVRDLARRKGRLVRVEESASYFDGETEIYRAELTSSTGLVVETQIRRPRGLTAADSRAGVVVIGGVRTGYASIELLPNDKPHVAIGLNYPAVMTGWDAQEMLERKDEVREALRDMPARLSLCVDYLKTLDYVDPDRIAIIGVSFGGFLVPRTAAVDRRLRDIALLYSGSDVNAILAAGAARRGPDAAAVLGSDLLLLGWQDMDPLYWIDELAGHHILMVNGLDDDELLNRSAEELFAKAKQPKELIWLPTGHLSPGDTALIQELVDTALARLPVLRP